MLRFLSVRHLAIIDELEVEFEPGLNIITGETGAGKSVLVEAIDLLVGGRACADLVRTGEASATVQAIFDRPDRSETIVRREISAQGRSRAVIDDVLATSGALRELGVALVDLHGQHEHQTLLDPARQLDHLDVFLADAALVAGVGEAFDAWRAAATALDRTQLDDREKRARIEMASFQRQEINHAAPRAGEDEALAADRRILANAERLTRLSTEAYAALYDGDAAVLTMLAGVWKRVAELAALDAHFAPYLDARDAQKSALEDLAFALRAYAADMDISPARLQEVEDRLAVLERLKRKYGPTLADVLARQAALGEELAALDAGAERVAALDADERRARQTFRDRAERLSAARRAAAARLSRALETELAELAMAKCRIDIRVTPLVRHEDWQRSGCDAVEIFLAPNPGEEPRPLARIASGGELSRIMLALRTSVTGTDAGRTLVFDEVDAGIGGEAADAVGRRLQALGRRHQVVCITHLPQIAARQGAHFHISKEVAGGRTTTRVTRLDAEGRELEIGRMIAGATVSPQVLSSARELIAARQGESEPKAKGESPGRAKAKGRVRGA
jgi:DNA repair protein RecN (Recombination protein N)